MVDDKFRSPREAINGFAVVAVNVKLVEQAVDHMEIDVHSHAAAGVCPGFHRNAASHAGRLAGRDAQLEAAAFVDSAHLKAVKLREKGCLSGELYAEQMLEEFTFLG